MSLNASRWLGGQPTLAASDWTAAHLDDPDRVCAGCHQEIYERYQQTPMARGSGLANEGLIAGEMLHPPSGIKYQTSLRDGQAWLTYDRTAPALHGEQRLQYFIGSGRRGRTYLFEQEGFWFESPVNYYSKKQVWDMAPNYQNVRQMPLTLPIDSNCLHCHTSEVADSEPAARNKYAGAPFRAGGVTCSSCHGDPGEHLARQGKGQILNPDHLAPQLRDSVCLQCHLEGDAAVYRAGKSLSMYRPGENLNDFVVYLVNTERPGFGERATSQYEALLRSACRRASGDRLTCTTCHDPHGGPTPEQKVEFYRSKCLGCHTGVKMAEEHHPEQRDCAECHMPTRASKDISHEQLTDHDIEKRPPKSEPANPEGTVRLKPVGGWKADEREVGLAYAQFAQHGDQHSGEQAMELLEKAEKMGDADLEVHLQLGFLDQVSGNHDGAWREYSAALKLDPQNTTALTNLAVLEAAKGGTTAALRMLNEVVEANPSLTEAGLDLAFMECRLGDKGRAEQVIRRIEIFDPDNEEIRRFRDAGELRGQRCRLSP